MKDKAIDLASMVSDHAKPSNGRMKVVPDIVTDNQLEQRATDLHSQEIALAAAREKLRLDKLEAEKVRIVTLREQRAELNQKAKLLKARSAEFSIGSNQQLMLLQQAQNFETEASEIHLPGDTEPETIETKNPGYYARNKNMLMALFTSAILAAAFWYVMRWIKVEDPQAVPYDATTFQKFLVTACFFSALQALKSFAVLIYYPIIHLFKSNVQEPDFDFSLYFKNRLTPIQQVCISLFIPCWFALEFVLLFSAKF
jgi:hypothetical protein